MKKITSILIILFILLTGVLLSSCNRNNEVISNLSEFSETNPTESIDSANNSESIDSVNNSETVLKDDENDIVIPSTSVSNSETKLPTFSIGTVKEDYLNLLKTGKFFISSQQEQDVLESQAKIYDAYLPRLFIEDKNYVLIYLNDSDGFLYKNEQRLDIHCTDLINIDSLTNIDGMNSSEILLLYEESKKEDYGQSTVVDAMAREFILRKLSNETGASSFEYPRFFRKGSEVLVFFEKNGTMEFVDISPITQ